MPKLGDLFPNDLQQAAGLKRPAPPRPRPGSPAEGGAHVFIQDLVPGQELEGIYLVVEATLRAAKNGSKYVQASFCDKTGSLPVRHWDATDADFAHYKLNGYVQVRARVETYRNAAQMIVFAAQSASGENINPADFLPVSTRPLPEMEKEFDALLATFTDPDYARLLAAIFTDARVREKFLGSPAATAIHHAWRGGLLEHVLSAAQTAQAIAASRPFLNRDLLLAGVVLHDLGKIEELDPGPGFTYTDTGRLCGHIALGALLVERFLLTLKDFPPKKRDLILHMILSHHGTHEFGSPVLPATAEAVALHYLECLDAKVQGIQTIIAQENARGNEGAWTEFARVADGRIYKGAKD